MHNDNHLENLQIQLVRHIYLSYYRATYSEHSSDTLVDKWKNLRMLIQMQRAQTIKICIYALGCTGWRMELGPKGIGT